MPLCPHSVHNGKRKSMIREQFVAIYSSHTAAEAAIKELQQGGFDMKETVDCWIRHSQR